MTVAEKLLAGYATGTLKPKERARLFQAALRDQALFDALADEDALRELLEDPDARARVLAALAEVPPVKVVPFYRRMPVLGAAASVLLAVTAGLAYWRTQGMERLPRVAPPAAAPAPTPTPPPEFAPPALAPLEERHRGLRQIPNPKPAPPAKAEAQQPLPPPAAAEASAVQQDAAAPAENRAKEIHAAAAVASAQADKTERKAKKAAPEYSYDKAPAVPTGQVVQGGFVGGVAAGAQAPAPPSAPPTWSLDPLGEGRLRVRVLWGGGHLYLLRREGATVTVHTPASQTRQGDRTESVFLVPAGGALDLYLLPAPSADPASLPAEGPVPGFHRRLREDR